MTNYYNKLSRYCSYRERCTYEVIQKLNNLEVSINEQKEIIAQLKAEKYLDDERFVKAYIHTKVYVKKWGRIKIKQALSQKKLEKELVITALANIDDALYIDNLYYLAERKWNLLSNKTPFEKKVSLFRYLNSKGYESELLIDWIKLKQLTL